MPCETANTLGLHRPLVSVVIPVYNGEAFVREALDSVLAQTFTDYEVIVVNDASTDSTPGILHRYERSARVRVVTHAVNKGLSAARNSGIRHARGKYMTFLDADDFWRPEKLAYQFAVLDEHPDVMLLGNAELYFMDGAEVTFPPLPKKPELRPVRWERLLCATCGLSPSNAIIRRECFEELGGFDESLRAAEDRDMWLRIVARFGGAVDEGVVNAYRLHGDNMSADPVRMKVNKKAVLQKAFREKPCHLRVRARAYAYLYLDVAILSYEARKRLRGLEHILKSFLAWPLPLGRDVRRAPAVRLVWAAKLLLGRAVFEPLWKAVRPRTRAAGGALGAGPNALHAGTNGRAGSGSRDEAPHVNGG